jgi:hypothetical protein
MMPRIGSDNPDGADNQQERLIELGWVLGFVDGEGCFSIGFVRQSGDGSRRGYKLGYQVAHRFVVSQGMRSLGCLEALRDFFAVLGGFTLTRGMTIIASTWRSTSFRTVMTS